MQARKILFVLENFYPHVGGVETLFLNLTKGLVNKGYEVVVITGKNFAKYKDEENIDGVKIKRVKLPNFAQRYFFSFLAIPYVIKESKNADIIHTTTYNGAFPTWFASKILNKKSLITIHEIFYEKWFVYQSFFKAIVFWLFERVIVSLKFDRHIAVSKSTMNQYKKIYPHRKYGFVYNGLDYKPFEKNKLDNREEFRNEIKWKDKFVILAFGRPAISKGFQYLVESMPKISKDITNVLFYFVWSKNQNSISLRDDYIKRIKELGLYDKCVIEDSKSQEELYELIQASDCVVVPSYSEGFGYAVVESCTLGARIVASDTTSIPEVISGKYNLFKNADSNDLAKKVIMMYNEEYKETKLKTFTNEEMVNNYIYIYKEMLDE